MPECSVWCALCWVITSGSRRLYVRGGCCRVIHWLLDAGRSAVGLGYLTNLVDRGILNRRWGCRMVSEAVQIVCVLWKAAGGARETNRRRQIMCGERGMLTPSGARVFYEREGRGSSL